MDTEVKSLKELSEKLAQLQQQGVKIKFPKQPGCCETLTSSFQWQSKDGNWYSIRLVAQ